MVCVCHRPARPSSQVGSALVEAFGAQNCIGTYCGTPVAGMIPFDLAKAAMNPGMAEELLATVYPTAVCICAGFTWVDGCEKNPQHANHMNCAGPAAIAAAARKLGVRTVWYSTDYVFDGGEAKGRGPYSEDDAPSPLNVYGSSKLAGEAAVLAADPTALVIRTNVVYGPEGNGKNFVYQLCRKLQAAEGMNVPGDQVRGAAGLVPAHRRPRSDTPGCSSLPRARCPLPRARCPLPRACCPLPRARLGCAVVSGGHAHIQPRLGRRYEAAGRGERVRCGQPRRQRGTRPLRLWHPSGRDAQRSAIERVAAVKEAEGGGR